MNKQWIVLVVALMVLVCGIAGANEVDDRHVAVFNQVTEDVGWPTGLGREAKLVRFTSDWTPPDEPLVSGGEFEWVVMETSALRLPDRNYDKLLLGFNANYRKNRGKLVQAGQERVVALVHRDLGVKLYLTWIFHPWVEVSKSFKRSNWFKTTIDGKIYAKAEYALWQTIFTHPENVRDFVTAGKKDRKFDRIEGDDIYLNAMHADGLCFHKKHVVNLEKNLKVKKVFLKNVSSNGKFFHEEHFEPKGKCVLTVTPPYSMPAGW